MEPKLLILRGLPGAGKSTLAKKIAKKFNVAHFENDQFLMHGDKYVWTPEDAKAAAKKCFESVMQTLRSGKDCIVSNVFVTRKAIDKYVNEAKRLGAKVMVIRMEHDYGNMHDVPERTLSSMKTSFQDYPGETIR